MQKSILFIIIILITFSLIQCSDKATENDDSLKLGEVFTLKFAQSVAIESENLSIRFTFVEEDSRCPANAYCFWPGMVEATIRVTKGSSDPINITLGLVDSVTQADEAHHLPIDTLGYRFTLIGITPYPQTSDPIELSEYSAILKVIRTPTTNTVVMPVTISDLPTDSIHIDGFDLDSVRIDGDMLTLTVRYGGGCRPHYFFLYMSPAAFMESNPVQADVYLRHVGNGDACMAYLKSTPSFDLRPIADLHQFVYGQLDSIIINVHEYNDNADPDTTINVVYTP